MTVLSPSGGAGASTLACLLADYAQRLSLTLVLDQGARIMSPWPGWAARPGDGISGLASVEPRALTAATSRLFPDSTRVELLTDTRVRDAEPKAPHPLAWWEAVLATTSHRQVVVDTGAAALPTLLRDRHGDEPSDLLRMLTDPRCVPVLVVPVSARGLDDALMAVTLLDQLTSGTQDLTVAVVAVSCATLPRSVRARLTLLMDRVGAVIHVPHERRLLGGTTPRLARVDARLRRAVAAIHAHAVLVADRSTGNDTDTPKENRHVNALTR